MLVPVYPAEQREATSGACTGPGWDGALCGRPTMRSGSCEAHYRQSLRGEELRPTRGTRPVRTCAVPGCERSPIAHLLCNTHNAQRARGRSFTPIRARILGGNGSRNERQAAMSRKEYREWRLSVFIRDSFTCQLCSAERCATVEIEANHIQTWRNCPSRRYDVSNGITLCTECHRGICSREHEFEGRFTALVSGMPVRDLTEPERASLRQVAKPCAWCSSPIVRSPKKMRRSKHVYCTATCRAEHLQHDETLRHGEANPKAKLSTEQVLAVRHMYAAGETQASIARKLCLPFHLVHSVVHRRSWKHV